MQEIRKVAKNQLWFRPIVERARTNYKNTHKLTDFDQNKLSRQEFAAVLEYISIEAELVPPTKQEVNEIFDEFDDMRTGKLEEYIEKEEYEKLCSRIFEMLNATIQS